MMRIRQTIVIAKPVEDVFAFVAAFEHEPRWRSEIREMRVWPTPVAVGSRVTEVMAVLGKPVLTTVEVVELRINRSVAAKFVSGPLPIDLSYTFAPAPGGTAATFALDIDLSRIPLARLFDPLASAIAQNYYGRQLKTLKKIIEGAGGFARDANVARPKT